MQTKVETVGVRTVIREKLGDLQEMRLAGVKGMV